MTTKQKDGSPPEMTKRASPANVGPDAYAYSVTDVRRTFSIPRSTLYELMKAGRIEAVKLGRRRLVLGASLRAYLASLPKAA